jgi:hypothetical protein
VRCLKRKEKQQWALTNIPLDLQIIDLVYEPAWAQLEARNPRRNTANDDDRRESLRKKVFAVATPGEVEFDSLLDRVMVVIPEIWEADPSKLPQ